MSKVELYVYDLSQGLAKNLSMGFLGQQFDGIWHTGIVVFGNEYFYGGGVNKMAPGTTPFGQPVEKVTLGTTKKSQSEFEVFLMKIGQSKFRADTYNLIENNCNNFTDDCSNFLISEGIPSHILNLPNDFFSTPIGSMMRGYFDQMMGGSGSGNFQELQQNFQPQNFQKQETVKVEDNLYSDSNKTVYTFKAAQVSQIIKKLKTLIVNLNLTKEDLQVLDLVENFLKNEKNSLSDIKKVVALFKFLLKNLSEKDIFPVLDLCRLGLLNSDFLNYCLLENQDSLLELIFKQIKPKMPMTSQLMILRICCNMANEQSTIKYILKEENFNTVVDMITESFEHEKESIRVTGASLASNLSLYSPKDNGDAETQLICSIIEFVPSEKSNDVVFKMLLALFRLLKNNKVSIELVKDLGFTLNKLSCEKPSEDCVKLQRTIKKLL